MTWTLSTNNWVLLLLSRVHLEVVIEADEIKKTSKFGTGFKEGFKTLKDTALILFVLQIKLGALGF